MLARVLYFVKHAPHIFINFTKNRYKYRQISDKIQSFDVLNNFYFTFSNNKLTSFQYMLCVSNRIKKNIYKFAPLILSNLIYRV